MTCDVVIATVGRPSLARLLTALAEQPPPGRVIVVDDRRGGGGAAAAGPGTSGAFPPPGGGRAPEVVLRSGGRGPAAARNAGWRASDADWIAFLDDDVVPPPGWSAALAADLAAAGARVGGVQGRIAVPLPADRRPTDWERNVAGLERARWATADLAYRRAALAQVGGFDERFRRAYREDADLALRVVAAGWTIERGGRTVVHPVGPASRGVSLRAQAGNADDALMRRLHGRGWRARAGAPPGRLPRHAATAAAGAATLILLAARRPRAAATAAALWLAGTAELALARILPGPRTPGEVATMAGTSAALPFAAVGWRLRGELRARRRGAAGAAGMPAARRPRAATAAGTANAPAAAAHLRPAAVLLDRDDTLVVNVPFNGDPTKVVAMPGAREALERLRDAGVPTAVVSNQSGIGRGLLTRAEVDAVNARVEALLGPLGPWVVCPHAPEEECACRKPAPGLVREAARRLGVPPERCVVIGDVGADVEAARAAGARGVLVPSARTRPEEVAAADEVAPDLPTAVELALGAAPTHPTHPASPASPHRSVR